MCVMYVGELCLMYTSEWYKGRLIGRRWGKKSRRRKDSCILTQNSTEKSISNILRASTAMELEGGRGSKAYEWKWKLEREEEKHFYVQGVQGSQLILGFVSFFLLSSRFCVASFVLPERLLTYVSIACEEALNSNSGISCCRFDESEVREIKKPFELQWGRSDFPVASSGCDMKVNLVELTQTVCLRICVITVLWPFSLPPSPGPGPDGLSIRFNCFIFHE